MININKLNNELKQSLFEMLYLKKSDSDVISISNDKQYFKNFDDFIDDLEKLEKEYFREIKTMRNWTGCGSYYYVAVIYLNGISLDIYNNNVEFQKYKSDKLNKNI